MKPNEFNRHPVFGQILQNFKTTTFPTVLEVINLMRFNLDKKARQSKIEKRTMMKTIATELIGIWNSAYVQTSDVNHVTNRLLGKEILGKVPSIKVVYFWSF